MAFVPAAPLGAPPPRAAALTATRRPLQSAGVSSCHRVIRPRAALENETGEKRSILSSIDNLLGGLLNLGGKNKVDLNASTDVPVDDTDVPVRKRGVRMGGSRVGRGSWFERRTACCPCVLDDGAESGCGVGDESASCTVQVSRTCWGSTCCLVANRVAVMLVWDNGCPGLSLTRLPDHSTHVHLTGRSCVRVCCCPSRSFFLERSQPLTCGRVSKRAEVSTF